MAIKIKAQRIILIDLKAVSKIIGLSEQHIRRMEREKKFPPRHSPVGRPMWSKRRVYYWLRRWGLRSERKERKK